MASSTPRSKIAELRDQAELTQLELSKIVGVTETTIANWEKGRSGLDWIDRVIKLCDALNCDPEDLIESDSTDLPPEKDPLSDISNVHKLLGTEVPTGAQMEQHSTI